jgi:hypothetical protein
MYQKSDIVYLRNQKECIRTLVMMMGYIVAIWSNQCSISFWIVSSHLLYFVTSAILLFPIDQVKDSINDGGDFTKYKLDHRHHQKIYQKICYWFLCCEKARQTIIIWGVCTRFLSVVYPHVLPNITFYTSFYIVVVGWIHSVRLYILGGYMIVQFMGYVMDMLSEIFFVYEVYNWCYYSTMGFHFFIGLSSFLETWMMTSKGQIKPLMIQNMEEYLEPLDVWTRYLSLLVGVYIVLDPILKMIRRNVGNKFSKSWIKEGLIGFPKILEMRKMGEAVQTNTETIGFGERRID